MNSLAQYIDLYRQHGNALDAPAPAVMNRARAQAAEALENAQLPRRGSEGYAVTDLAELLAPDYGININRMPFRADLQAAFKCDVPNITTLMGVETNDIFAPTAAMQRLLPPGVVVCAFSNADTMAPGVLDRYYNTLADSRNIPVSLNTLLAQDGILVYVSKFVKCTKPIQLVRLLGGVNSPVLVARRLLVVLDAGAEAQLLVCDHASDNVANATDTVTEISVGPGASLRMVDMEENNDATKRLSSLYAAVDADASLHLTTVSLRCGKTRNSTNVSLNAPGAHATVNGMAITSGHQTLDNASRVYHPAPDCTSAQLFKYVVDDHSQGAFEGLINVAPGAERTNASQSCRSMLADTHARMHAAPQLIIDCDDVKCGHGATTGQMSEEQLFYMRQRGIPLDEARTMLMQAFMADVIDSVAIEPLRDRLRYLVDRRLSGASGDCGSCSDCHI